MYYTVKTLLTERSKALFPQAKAKRLRAEFQMNPKKKEKLFSLSKKDFDIQTFCSGGPGGQHQNKTESGFRILHRASGAVGESRSERSQHANKKLAMQRLVNSHQFKLWLNRSVCEILTGKTIEQRVEQAMAPENLRVESRDDNGKWTRLSDQDNQQEIEG